METKTEAQEVVEKISRYVNNYSMKPSEFIEAMNQEHRTLQQSFTRLMFHWLEHCADETYRHDLRNEASHKICKEMLESFQKVKAAQNPGYWDRVKPSDLLPTI